MTEEGSEMKFYFDEKEHKYYLGNYILPSVTQIIQGVFGKRDWYSDWHAQRGKAIHLAIHYLINNKLDWGSVDERILPRIKAFQAFMKDFNFEIVESEKIMYSKKMMFAGTMDLLFYDPDKKEYIIADIKSTIEPIVEIQLGGYSLLYAEKKIKKLMAIELKDNTYSVRWNYDMFKAQKLFKACLTIYNFKVRSKML